MADSQATLSEVRWPLLEGASHAEQNESRAALESIPGQLAHAVRHRMTYIYNRGRTFDLLTKGATENRRDHVIVGNRPDGHALLTIQALMNALQTGEV